MKSMTYICFLFFISSFINVNGQGEVPASCGLDFSEVTFLQSFEVNLDPAGKNDPPPIHRVAVILKKGTHYRFNICNADGSEGEGIIQLYDAGRLLGSTYNIATGKMYTGFDFICQKTSRYYIFISFKDGKGGQTVGVLSMVK